MDGRGDTKNGRSPFFALGKFGQAVAVFPKQDVVIVRLGADDGGVDWRALLGAVAGHLAGRG